MTYQYSGYMREHMEQAIKMRLDGVPCGKVAAWMYDEAGVRSPYITDKFCDSVRVLTILSMAAGIRNVMALNRLTPTVGTDRTLDKAYSNARAEHAFLLRTEGLIFDDIGNRLGVTKERARQLVLRFGRRMQRAMLYTKVTVT